MDNPPARRHHVSRIPMKAFLLLLCVVLGVSAAEERPNILFAIADDWGAHAGAYGTKWVKTPAFDRVASEGAAFQARLHAEWRSARRRARASSRGATRGSSRRRRITSAIFPPEFKGWAEALAEHGWFVGYTMKGWGPGRGEGRGRQAAADDRQAVQRAQGGAADDGHQQQRLRREFRRLPRRRADRTSRGAFWYGAIEPHRGYEFGSGVAKGGKKLTRHRPRPGLLAGQRHGAQRHARLRIRGGALRPAPRADARGPGKARPARATRSSS